MDFGAFVIRCYNNNSNSSTTSNFESANKKPSFIKVAAAFLSVSYGYGLLHSTMREAKKKRF